MGGVRGNVDGDHFVRGRGFIDWLGASVIGNSSRRLRQGSS